MAQTKKQTSKRRTSSKNPRATTRQRAKSPKKVMNKKKKNARKIVIKLPKLPEKTKTICKKVWHYCLTIVLPVIAIFFAVDSFVQYLNNDYSIAVVNGVRIPRSKYIHRLEQSYGNTIANNLIQEEIIKQKAESENVTVSDEEIDAKISEFRDELGGDEKLMEALKQYNMTMDDLRDQVKIDILLTKLVEGSVTYTDDDLRKFFDQYKEQLYPSDKDVKFEDVKDEIEKYYRNNQISTAKQNLISQLMADAQDLIQNNATNKPRFKIFGSTKNIIDNLSK